MRKTLLIAMLVLLGITQAGAQSSYDDDMLYYMRLVNEGTQWVNEKVIIDHGDTTSYFYTYEIQGDTQVSIYNMKKCHYFTGNQIDSENDSIICLLMDNAPRVFCFNNHALDKVEQDGRNLLERIYYMAPDINEELLYHYYYPWINLAITDMYIPCQTDPVILTEENLIVAEPIEIDGYTCHRLAYIDEQGDTVAYVVEGIGFDSRDMGDLLTPFTRKPDPDADYQEYCGLSHVIKDGKIIYKGMRFNPNAIVIPGDVDGDGEITISDANSVIDIVVMGGNAGHTHSPAADANGDGEITIADVNAIVNLIQGD